MLKNLGNNLKKMSQRALWRGDRDQAQLINNHGLHGVRQNILNDTASYKKEAIGGKFRQTQSSENNRNQNQNTKVQSAATKTGSNKLGGSILESLR